MFASMCVFMHGWMEGGMDRRRQAGSCYVGRYVSVCMSVFVHITLEKVVGST